MSACEKGLSSCSVSFASGANDGEACPKHWVAALVQMNCERKVADRLNSLGISNYVPVQEEVHQWSDRKKKIARVVIPMVVFANVDSKQEKVLRNLSFVYKLITYPGQNRPAVIPDIQIAQLRLMVEKSDSEILIQDISLRTGDKVRVTRGALKGLEGLVCSAGDNRHMVAIRLECLGYACVNIPITDIEQIK